MGSGSNKTAEAFTLTPAGQPPAPADTTDSSPTAAQPAPASGTDLPPANLPTIGIPPIGIATAAAPAAAVPAAPPAPGPTPGPEDAEDLAVLPPAQLAGELDQPDLQDQADTAAAATATSPAATPAASPAEPDVDDQVPTLTVGPTEDLALTPVPAVLPVGHAVGTPLLVGGADLVDSLVTVTSYADSAGTGAHGSREVLQALVAPDAEGKILEALSVSTHQLIPVQVEKTLAAARLPLDTSEDLYGQLTPIARSINSHLKAGTPVPDHRKEALTKVTDRLTEITEDPGSTAAEKAMATEYLTHTTAMAQRLTGLPAGVSYADARLPNVNAHTVTGTVMVTEYVPAPLPEAPEGLLPTTAAPATRIAPTIGSDGTSSWDGSKRSKASGTEYHVDLGDGYRAIYRPRAGVTTPGDPSSAPGASTDFSLRGQLEIVAPPGPGRAGQLVHRLGQLNLVNRPLTAAEGEWSYLQRNVTAQGLAAKPGVAAALAQTEGLEDAMTHVLVAQHAHEAIGLDAPALARFAKQLRLEAEAKALPAKVGLLRDAVATATGHTNGAALAASPGYDPVPRTSGGWLTWGRFDVEADTKAVKAAFSGRGLGCNVTGNNIGTMLVTSAMASTERRRLMGVQSGLGMSEAADQSTGGANAVFLRVRSKPTSGPTLFWSDPTALLRRSDWYAYNHDSFGAVAGGSKTASGMTRDPSKVAGHHGGGNEIMFVNGIDLLGAEAPTEIRCQTPAQRTEVLAQLASAGISSIGGRPAEKVVL